MIARSIPKATNTESDEQYMNESIQINNVIAIRFSLRMKKEWLQKAYGDEANREAWFAMRADIFKNWIGRAISEQTVKVHRVVVFMDTEDTYLWDKYLDLPLPFVPIFTTAADQASRLREFLYAENIKNIVLSRVDSDDTIAIDYIENLNRDVAALIEAGERRRYIVACNGFVTNLTEIQSLYHNCCPFVSLYIKDYDGSVIYDFEHLKILGRNPVLNQNSSWMQIIHGSNIANKLHRKSRFDSDDVRKMIIGPNLPVETSWPAGFFGIDSQPQ
ncbi:hypothetical protein H4P12_13870 [Paracoccus sp. 11-3]|uniref:Rhamnosyl transferase n=1 Tax=Paracoccus amoyensis TaxID=2760093 RepID=A0A926JDK8_9RHOB|nr:glycosyltransferase [Paracoccus amoyensis]MBC9247764.1 hypothetical protein [Paracoccus amoyensis]